MKKFLLSLAVTMTAAFGAFGQDTGTTLDVNDATNIKGTTIEEVMKEDGNGVQSAKHVQPLDSFELGGYTFTFEKGGGSTDAAYYWATSTNAIQDKTVRVYNGNKMTMKAPAGTTMTSVKFTCAKGKANQSFTASTGTVAQSSDKVFTWTGSAEEFTLTIPATFQIRTITLGKGGEGGGDPVVPPTPVETIGDGTEANPYTVADVIALNNVDKNSGPEAWITGFIVGTFNGKTLDDFTSATGDGASISNLAIAAAANETDHTKMIPVALPQGAVRTALNLQDRPALLGREVSLKGNLMGYFGTAGMKNTSDYSVVGGLPEIPVTETESLTSFIENQDLENFYKIKGAVTVFYQSPDKKYTFITDGASNLEVYGALANAYTNGDVLTGIIGKYGYWNGMPQMTPQVDSFGEAAKGEAVAPVAKALADVQVAEYVVLSNVNIVEVPAAEEGKSSTWNVVDGAETRQLFDRFALGTIKAAEGVTIVGIGSVYNENNQIFPVEIDYDNSAISEISAAANGLTVVYDLQGRRLAAPVKGINIINGKKVLVK